MERPYVKAVITEKAERAARNGHPWVYGEEITELDGKPENGDIVDVLTKKGRWLGTGFYNDNSKIRIRIISRNTNDRFDEAFFERRIRHAVDYRIAAMGEEFSACRLIFGEADFFPGLTVDKFNDILVTEVLSYGMDKRKDTLYPLLIKVLAEAGTEVNALYERNEDNLRNKEGLKKYKGFYRMEGLRDGLDGHVEICENGIYYDVDYINGQKTGFFLDQKYNRAAAARLAKGKNVLDCCTHTGAFALNAAKAGAKKVTALDVSQDALDMAQKNAARNGLSENICFVRADVFDFLTELTETKSKEYDFIILDPPAFTKSGATLKNAYRGYKEINLKAMRSLPRGGYLATCSCSHFMTRELFEKMLTEAALDAGVQLKQIEARQQAPDHPVLWGVPETDYLKFYLFQVT
ncbi:MAG TPA: class I SAM-dependent rRNA methyltransferase [Clostridia bacterium]|nr:class I SAM-dependent rRNA methyltransferase [Clostridia bacterium]